MNLNFIELLTILQLRPTTIRNSSGDNNMKPQTIKRLVKEKKYSICLYATLESWTLLWSVLLNASRFCQRRMKKFDFGCYSFLLNYIAPIKYLLCSRPLFPFRPRR